MSDLFSRKNIMKLGFSQCPFGKEVFSVMRYRLDNWLDLINRNNVQYFQVKLKIRSELLSSPAIRDFVLKKMDSLRKVRYNQTAESQAQIHHKAVYGRRI